MPDPPGIAVSTTASSPRDGRAVQALADDPRMAAVVRSLARLGRMVEKACQAEGISLAQYRLLLFVDREPQRAGELATRASVSRPTLTNLVKTLERDGLIRRSEVDGDRRGTRLEPTDAGRAALATAERVLRDRLGEILGEVDDVERLLEACTDLGGALDRVLERRLAPEEVDRADG